MPLLKKVSVWRFFAMLLSPHINAQSCKSIQGLLELATVSSGSASIFSTEVDVSKILI